MAAPFVLVLWPLLLFLGLVNAQQNGLAALVAATPECALPCIINNFQAGGCVLTNFETLPDCVCRNITLQAGLSECVQKSCKFEDQVRAVNVESQLCKGYPQESRSHEVMVVAIVCAAITFPVVGLRCLSRWKVTSRLWWDDYTVVMASVFLAGLAGIQIASAILGFGSHYWQVKPENGATILQLFYAVQLLYILIQVTAKVSILIFYDRIFTSRWFKITIRVFITFLIGHGMIFFLLIVFQCLPVYSIWERSVERKCLNVTAIGYAGAVFSIIEDIVILVLPIPDLLKLQFGTKTKITLIFMFSIGSFACVTSMVRLKYMLTFANSFDTTWDNVDIVVWSVIEEFCAILCASLPAIKPLLVQYIPSLFTTHKSSSYGFDKNSALSPRNQNNKFKELPDLPKSAGGVIASKEVSDKVHVRSMSPADSDEGNDMELHSLRKPKSGF